MSEIPRGGDLAATLIQRIEPLELFSEAVIHGGVVYLSGQVALAHRGGELDAQVGEILTRIDALLRAAGSDRTRLLSATVFLTRAEDIGRFNALWAAWLPRGATPARTTVVSALTSPDFRLEVTVVAAA